MNTNNKEQTQYLTVPNTMLNAQDTDMKCDDISDCSSPPNFSSDNNTSISYQISTQQTNDSSQYTQNMQDTIMQCNNNNNMNEELLYDQRATMIDNGFEPQCELSKTLQGCIWRVHYKALNCDAIIKITNKVLSKQNMGIDHRNGRYIFNCKENIKQEINMLHSLNNITSEEKSNTINPAMIHLYTVFEDEFNIFVVMEDGERDLLGFINECHEWIKNKQMLLSDWNITVQIIMQQMAQFVYWLHYERHVCHLDISLENMSIQNIQWQYNTQSKTHTLRPTFQIKFIDFGVAQLFTEKKADLLHAAAEEMVDEDEQDQQDEFNEFDAFDSAMDESEEEEEEYYSDDDDNDDISFACNTFVGKLKYESPNVFNRCTFDARKADVWSLGVCWFMICTGCNAWNMPSNNDMAYDLIVNKQQLKYVLKSWNRCDYVNPDMQKLFYRIFSDEMYRATSKEILQYIHD